MEWFKILQYPKNPLNYKPRLGERLFGYDVLLDELFYRIEAGSIVFLEGRQGKTGVLLKIIEKYKGKGRVAYVNCREEDEEPDIRKILAKGKKIVSKSELPKDMIILLDNITDLSSVNAQRMKYFFDQGNILAIVMTGKKFETTRMPQSIRHRIGKRIYKLKELTEDEAVDLVMERLEFREYFREEQIYKIAEKSENIKELFANCENALRLMLSEDKQVIDDSLINKVFGVKEDVVV